MGGTCAPTSKRTAAFVKIFKPDCIPSAALRYFFRTHSLVD